MERLELPPSEQRVIDNFDFKLQRIDNYYAKSPLTLTEQYCDDPTSFFSRNFNISSRI